MSTNWNVLPPSVQQAATFVFATNADRRLGQVDTAQTMAAKLGCMCVHAYFARLRVAIEDGELDPMTRDEIRELLNGEESSGETTGNDCHIGGLSSRWIDEPDDQEDDSAS